MESTTEFKEFYIDSQASYQFIEEIGRGGMGIVYLAARNSGGIIDYVVIKTLKSLTPEDENSLRQEANLAAQLRHENIVKTYGLETMAVSALPKTFVDSLGTLSYTIQQEVKTKRLRRLDFRRKKEQKNAHIETSKDANSQKMFLMVMDYVDGINLKSFHYEHLNLSLLIPPYIGAFIISRIARALCYAHNYLVHRDISPENILINTQGTCKLSDFGIAIATQQKPDYWAGKLSYMAPEQTNRRAIDERIDIYSLGSVAYQILTGIPLVQLIPNATLEDQIANIKKQLKKGVIPPCEVCKDIPKELSDIIMKMLAENPDQRYQRAGTVASDLEKNFLYAKGYGPTNNSLSTYMAIFENKFTMYNEEQLDQLCFLKNMNNEISIKRDFDGSIYTEKGLQLAEEKMDKEIYKKFQASLELMEIEKSRQEVRLPYLKVKYLDNVIESFLIAEETLTVGSQEDCHIFLDAKEIEPQHCNIQRSGENVYLTSRQNKAQILINNKEYSEKELREGDKLKMGTYTLFFIKQFDLPDLDKSNIFSFPENIDTNSLLALRDFSLYFLPEQETLLSLARLVDQILSKTNLSGIKLGIISNALIELIQMLCGNNNQANFHIRILTTPVRLIFACKSPNKEGYSNVLGNFKKHRQKLTTLLAKKEKEVPSTLSPSGEENFMDSNPKLPGQQDLKIEAEFDLENFDPSMLAATLFVHAFDRIEFKKEQREVELAIYL
ncbi:MAG: protein kinase [Candidatus Brocadiae bacterium]|nr:protein kinase [Candidatus Brocadiia bacterium]